MSNTELYHEQLNELSLRIMGGIKNRMEPLGDLDKALTQLSQTDAIKGNAADAMKAYIREVHMTLNQTLQLLLFNYETAMVKYVNGYLDQVDSDKDFKLIKEDFDAHEHNLSSHRSDFTSFGKKLKAISDEAEDIVSLSGAGSKRIDNVVDEMNKMKETVSNLRDKWNNYEDRYRDFDQVQDLIVQATSLVKNTLSVPRGYSYSPGSFRNLMSKDFIKAFEVNAKYAQDPKNQKALTAGVDRILKNYKADQKRIAEEAKEKAKKEGLIGLIFDYVQIQAGGVIALVGVGLIPFTGGTSISLTVLGCSMVVGGVNSGINHASMAFTGKECNLIGNLTNGAVQWYNKNIGEPLVKTGNPVAQFVAGFGNASIEMVGAMGQFSVYDTGKAVHTLLTNPEAQAQFKAGVGHWWKQVRSGDAYTLGQTTATVLSVVVDPDDVGAAVSKASKAESLLGKMGTFSKSIAISSAENAKNIATLPWRTIDNLGSKVADLRTVLSEGKGVSVVVSSAKDAKNLLTKVKSTVSDVKTVSASFAKAFGKTYAKECRKYVNTCFSASGAVGAGAEAIYKASKDGFKEAKNALRTVKDEKNGFVDGVADTNAPWKAIDDYRNQRQGLEVLPEDYEFIKGDGKNTVAFNDTCDKRYFGVNSTLRTDAEKGLAKKYFNKLVEEGYFPKGSIYPRGKAQFITHAEGYTLIKAYEENGIDIGKSVTIYVDRPTCGFCQNNLPKLQASMGIDVLTVINKNGDVFRCDLRKYTSMTVSDVNAEKLIKIKSK